MSEKPQDQASKEALEKKAAQEKEVDEAKRGVKYLTLVKRRTRNEVILQGGIVKQASSAQMNGWSLERVLDWADRCKVAVFVSGERGAQGKQIPTRLLPVQA